MAVKTTDTKQAVAHAVERFGARREELIPILSHINRELGYLSPEVMTEVSRELRLPKSRILTVASFYEMLNTKPVGRHVIKFCESAPCHVVGGQQVWLALQEHLQLKPGETSSDGKWTLSTTSCLGLCSVGPVMLIDEDVYGNLTPAMIPGILARYK
jgi:NADH-quinone oxidoreductase subunit E